MQSYCWVCCWMHFYNWSIFDEVITKSWWLFWSTLYTAWWQLAAISKCVCNILIHFCHNYVIMYYYLNVLSCLITLAWMVLNTLRGSILLMFHVIVVKYFCASDVVFLYVWDFYVLLRYSKWFIDRYVWEQLCPGLLHDRKTAGD